MGHGTDAYIFVTFFIDLSKIKANSFSSFFVDFVFFFIICVLFSSEYKYKTFFLPHFFDSGSC